MLDVVSDFAKLFYNAYIWLEDQTSFYASWQCQWSFQEQNCGSLTRRATVLTSIEYVYAVSLVSFTLVHVNSLVYFWAAAEIAVATPSAFASAVKCEHVASSKRVNIASVKFEHILAGWLHLIQLVIALHPGKLMMQDTYQYPAKATSIYVSSKRECADLFMLENVLITLALCSLENSPIMPKAMPA